MQNLLTPTFRVPVPAARDPFINTPLLSLGKNPQGIEQFWISSWNSLSGNTSALIGEDGSYRIYQFPDHPGFYSVVKVDDDTLWACNFLSEMVKIDLNTGKTERFPTGARRALMFQGMPYDKATGKVFIAANVVSNSAKGGCPTGVSFDLNTQQPGQVIEGVADDAYMRWSFPNSDGTWSMVMIVPQLSVMRWDPQTDQITSTRLAPDYQFADTLLYQQLIMDDLGRAYLPKLGWFDGAKAAIVDGPMAQQEATWFARRGNQVWGVRGRLHYEHVDVVIWDLESGREEQVAVLRDTTVHGVNLTASGKLVSMSVYGEFSVRDGNSGELLVSRCLPASAVQATDCLERIDDRRLLGTPFITQRFWEVNLETAKGHDCGRAAPGWGEVLETWRIRGKIYMAEYGGGTLVEYDPRQRPRFPENPRLVAESPDGMRPVAAAEHQQVLWYACSANYGKLGSTLTRYDTQSGQANHAINPLTDQKIISLWYDEPSATLLAATSISSDCDSAVPTTDRGQFARLDPVTLEVLDAVLAPQGALHCKIIRPLDEPGTYAVTLGGTDEYRWARIRHDDLTAVQPQALPQNWQQMDWSGLPGIFVVRQDTVLLLHDLENAETLCELCTVAAEQRVMVKGGSIYVVGRKGIVVYDNFLADMIV